MVSVLVDTSSGIKVDASNYREYKVYYLATHRNIWGRRMHAAGSAVAAIFAMVSLLRLDLRPLVVGILAAYGLSWGGDLLFENRTPASLKHPIWALGAHSEMVRKMISGDKVFQ